MIISGSATDLVCHVVTIADGLDKTSGTIYTYVRRSSDGYFLKSDATWASGAPAGGDVPTATHLAHGMWRYTMTEPVCSALTVGDSVVARMTDNETAASATVISDIVEHIVDRPAYIVQSSLTASIAASQTVLSSSIVSSQAATSATIASLPSASQIAESVYTRLSASFDQVLGLMHKNSIIDSMTYDSNGNLLTSRLRCYNSSANMLLSGSTGLLYTYHISASYGVYGSLSGTLNRFWMELQP